MNQTISINSNRRAALHAAAWVCLALCLGIAMFAGLIATLTAPSRFAALDPLPVLRWEDVR